MYFRARHHHLYHPTNNNRINCRIAHFNVVTSVNEHLHNTSDDGNNNVDHAAPVVVVVVLVAVVISNVDDNFDVEDNEDDEDDNDNNNWRRLVVILIFVFVHSRRNEKFVFIAGLHGNIIWPVQSEIIAVQIDSRQSSDTGAGAVDVLLDDDDIEPTPPLPQNEEALVVDGGAGDNVSVLPSKVFCWSVTQR